MSVQYASLAPYLLRSWFWFLCLIVDDTEAKHHTACDNIEVTLKGQYHQDWVPDRNIGTLIRRRQVVSDFFAPSLERLNLLKLVTRSKTLEKLNIGKNLVQRCEFTVGVVKRTFFPCILPSSLT
jgi:hypothetical protein